MRFWDARKDVPRRAPVLETLAATLADLDRRPIPWRQIDALATALRHRAEAPAPDDWHAGRAAGLREAADALEDLLRHHR